MDDWSESVSSAAHTSPGASEKAGASKQAACLSCRRSKTRCIRNAGDSRCRRCSQTENECVIPDYHVGRRKGIKNKRIGLEKAVHYIEKVIKTSKTTGEQTEDGRTALHLQNLLREAQSLLPNAATSGDLNPALQGLQGQAPPSISENIHPTLRQDHLSPYSSSPGMSAQGGTDDNLPLDDAENPLQLLARASDLTEPSYQLPTAPNVHSQVYIPSMPAREDTLRMFFGPFRPHLDVGEDIDPVDMGFVTLEEVDILFTFFYQNLAHTRWGLDPVVHTAAFVRSRSAFLFTSILAASALFMSSTAALSKRLSVHCRHLAHHIMAKRYRSPEIVLAFMVNIPWMPPGKHWADDETCSYMAMALTVAIDLSLNKLLTPSPSIPHANIPINTTKSDCITARKALDMDGFEDIDPSSTWGRRLLRRRERIWLALFVLDRGVCLARGRDFTVPISPLVQICDNWHRSDICDTWDGSIISSAVLRRDLTDLIEGIKRSCDPDRLAVLDGSAIAQSLQEMIDDFFSRWYATWEFDTRGTGKHKLPPYVEILASHTRLSTYSTVINLPTAPVEVSRFFRAAGLSASLNVMRAAVQGESQLKSMPNNTVIMISFSACFALYLGTMAAGNNSSLASSIRVLIEESADVLERIGATPIHRTATSTLYGRHLREIVRNSARLSDVRTLRSNLASQPETLPHPQHTFIGQQQQHNAVPPNDPTDMISSDHLQFSAMSDYQIVEAINNAGGELETYLPNFQIDDTAGLDWLDWFNFSNT